MPTSVLPLAATLCTFDPPVCPRPDPANLRLECLRLAVGATSRWDGPNGDKTVALAKSFADFVIGGDGAGPDA